MKAKLIRWLSKFSLSDILNPLGIQKTVVIDFSSPNVAKPFHLGHFRATITGNFIRNVNEAAGHRVIGINYLGDWGSQFDLLSQGWHKYGSEEGLRADPLRYLYKLYVQMNSESAASTDMESVRFATGETLHSNADRTAYNLRTIVKELTEEHLKQTYARMNVHFTKYEYESDYVDAAQDVADLLLARGIAVRENGGVTCIPANVLAPGAPRVVLLKSNGNSLYLTRDLAAAISRYERYRFDRIHYVVEIGQKLHFDHLRSVLRLMNYPWATQTNHNDETPRSQHDQWHIPFGRVLGASTRRGEGLFLDDILNNAQKTIRARMNHSPNTRVFDSDSDRSADAVADHLGLTCLVIEMLRVARLRPLYLSSFLGYPVKHDELVAKVDNVDLSGLGLQYAHARLCSLERRILLSEASSGHKSLHLKDDLLSRLIKCTTPPTNTTSNSAFLNLLDHLDKLPGALQSSYMDYEPCILVHYATRLATLINSAWKQLPVIQCETEDDKLWRLSLFLASRDILSLCLRLLGLHPQSDI